jgi:hypothetical protein
MAKDNGADGWRAVGLGIFMGFGWFGWSFWLMYSSKSPATIFGLVAVCLVLLVLTVLWAKDLALFVSTAVILPFLFVGAIIFFSVRLLLLILSPICVISVRLFWRPVPKCNYCRLCDKCDAIVERSRLLLGSSWILTRSVEKHAFYIQSELGKSAKDCHLCRLLFLSVDAFKEQDYTADPKSSQPTQDKNRSSIVEEGVPRNSDSTNGSGSITVKIWMRRYFSQSPVLRIQLCGASIAKSKPVEIQWKVNGNSTLSLCM